MAVWVTFTIDLWLEWHNRCPKKSVFFLKIWESTKQVWPKQRCARMNGINEWMNKWMNEWKNERMNDWMNKWMNEWKNERMDKWISGQRSRKNVWNHVAIMLCSQIYWSQQINYSKEYISRPVRLSVRPPICLSVRPSVTAPLYILYS